MQRSVWMNWPSSIFSASPIRDGKCSGAKQRDSERRNAGKRAPEKMAAIYLFHSTDILMNQRMGAMKYRLDLVQRGGFAAL